MTAEELLKPRFEVIADYPNNEFGKVGDILDRDWGHYPNGEEFEPEWKISDYPHLFRKLEWWEKRTEDEMPKKVIVKESKEIYDIQYWRGDIGKIKLTPEQGGFLGQEALIFNLDEILPYDEPTETIIG